MATTKVKCIAPHPIDLAGGAPLGPGEWASVDIEDPHNAALIADGHIVAAPDKPARSKE